jgi:hypothetical protein
VARRIGCAHLGACWSLECHLDVIGSGSCHGGPEVPEQLIAPDGVRSLVVCELQARGGKPTLHSGSMASTAKVITKYFPILTHISP